MITSYLDFHLGMVFLSEEHQEKFKKFLELSGVTANRDRERASLFYILSGNEELYNQIDKIYSFTDNMIKTKGKKILSSSGERLLKLAFQLYNGLSNSISVTEVFQNLDSNNKRLALNAIAYRYDIA